ncbi:arabinose-proton symporter [Xylogone sp. PMI_703]|nr:arabinose-proton symporter [Xylogone sp. PMI_703]
MGKLIPNTFNLIVVLYVALGSTACSYGLSVIGSTIGQPTFYTGLNMAPPGSPGYSKTANLISAYNGVNSGGAIIGAAFTAWFADWAGRKRSIQLGALILAIGGAISAGSVNPAMFIVARTIAGVGIGMLITSIPMYQSEVSTPESRGFMCCMHGVMFAVGYSLSAWIGFGTYFSPKDSSFGWRFPLAFQCGPSLLLLVGSSFLPYSPRWLLQKDRLEEALAVLKRLHTSKEDPEGREAQREFYQMRKQLELDRSIKASTGAFEIFKTPSNRKRALFAFFFMFGNMFTGILVVTNYGILLYEAIGLKGFMPLLLSGIYVLITFPCNVFTALYVDKIGRRTLLLVGLGGCTIANIFECALQATYLGSNNKKGLNAAIFFIFFFIIFWACCLDATQYLYTAEIFPTHIRSQGTAIGMAGLFCGTLVVLVAGPIALNNISWRFYLVLIIPPAIEWVCIYLWFPETKQRSLEDIAEAFGDKVAVHYYHATLEEQVAYVKDDFEKNGEPEATSEHVENELPSK